MDEKENGPSNVNEKDDTPFLMVVYILRYCARASRKAGFGPMPQKPFTLKNGR